MESNYAKYLRETGLSDIIEDEFGYATYIFEEDYAYILDIYVVPEKRKSGKASEYADQIASIAKEKGYKALVGSTNLKMKKPKPKHSMLTLISYGFEPWFASNDNMIYYRKEI